MGQALACKFSRTDLSPAEFSYKRVSDYTRSSKGSNQYNHTHFAILKFLPLTTAKYRTHNFCFVLFFSPFFCTFDLLRIMSVNI